MGFQILMLLAASALFCEETPQADVAPNGDALQGAWQLSGGEADGNVLSQAELKDGKLEIKGDHYTIHLAEIGKIEGTQKLGVEHDLKTIDATNSTNEDKGKTCLGIYELEGDEFRVIFAQPGKDRPAKFETAPNSGQWMHVWKRVK
ncbi:TIGR03067 domain-containing protein [Blastopirellula sp. J2-11]|uniref:TIGR03067 domain-containing protein n=1 Tax=Blastopirellula sp. J2-11 TaxID=2943192 RepID=UPI0021C5B3FA|nr:TIGR03067 domain-containing protein [Blastopirellula sp. J2-11]UUO05737.1 TIGR03067 domain-containing protein [Blastopirellula sp. J2-11]